MSNLPEAKEVLDIMRLDKEQQYGYNRYLDYLHLKASEVLSLQAEAEEKLREAEEKVRKDENHKKAVETAKIMLVNNEPNDKIALYTGLTPEQIEQLRNKKE